MITGVENRRIKMTGKTIDDRYRLEKRIGAGGMADVYMAKDLLLDRVVAVKILHSNFCEDNDFIVRFRHEAQSAGKLMHPNIVGIYDVGNDQGIHYIVMEFVEGITLKQYIQTHPAIPIDTAVRIAIEIASALEAAHANGIVHCDIKPHNILLTETGKVKVTDFGIARAINSATVIDKRAVLGSVHYLSPEQAAGDKITEKADIYSLGVVLYEMLTHHLPFEGETAVSIALQHMRGEVPRPAKINPAISPMLEECVLTALQKDPEKRYPSISDFVAELKLAQGFTTSIYKPAHHDFSTMAKPLAAKKNRQLQADKENKFNRFITEFPQKYIWLAMIVLFLICFVWAFFSFGNFWSAENINLPSVVGKPVEVAQKTLKDVNLKVSIDEIASDNIPAGQVISQTPAPGSSVKAQRIIHLTVSKGGAAILIPNLKGLSLKQVKERLDKLELTLGAIENGNDTSQPSDVVISQSPQVSTKVNKGTQVNIVVNVKQEITVPKLTGMSLNDAEKALNAAHMTLGKVSFLDGSTADDGEAVVISQDPAGGISTTETTVDLTLGKKEKSRKKSGTVSISIPKSGDTRHVIIYVIDDNGKSAVFDKQVKAGTNIRETVEGEGVVRVQVLIDGNIVQDGEL